MVFSKADPDSDFARHPLGEWASIDRVPDAFALPYDLANSLDERTFSHHARRQDRRDLLESPADLHAWLHARGLSARSVTGQDLDLARELRAALRLAARANADRSAAAAAGRAMGRVAVRLPLRVALDAVGHPHLEPALAGASGALSSVLAAPIAASDRDEWSRLKMCAAEDCRWVFYDASKPRTGRWCEMAVCGNRVKTRAYRRRRSRGGEP